MRFTKAYFTKTLLFGINFLGLASSKTVAEHCHYLENIVFLQLIRQNQEVYFHSETKECNFVLRDGYKISQVIQVTTSLQDPKTKNREIQGLLEAMETYELEQGLIITEDESGIELVEHNKVNIR